MNPAQQLIADILSGTLVVAAEIAERIQALTDPELAEYEELANAAFDSIRAGEVTVEGGTVLEVLTRIGDSITTTQETAAVRIEAAAADEAAIQALQDRIRPQASDTPPAEGGEGEGGEGGEETPPAEPVEETPPAEGTEGEETPPAEGGEGAPAEGEPQAVAAAASPARVANPSIPALVARAAARPAPTPAAANTDRTRGVLVAAGGDRNFTAGQEMSLDAFHEAILNRADALKFAQSRGAQSYLPVASIVASYPEAQRLGPDSHRNTQLLADALDDLPMTSLAAAGGPCAPPVTLYDQISIAETTRVLGSDLPTFEATRAGVQVIPSPDWTSFGDGVGIWTQEMDIEAVDDPDIIKPCVRVDCDDPVTYRTYAVTTCLTLGNWFEKAFPERLSAIRSGMGAWTAKIAERALLDAIGTLSVDAPDSVQALGTTRDVLAYLDERVSVWRGFMRVNDSYRLDLWLPRWLHDMMRADITRGLMSSGATMEQALAIANSTIDSLIEARNVSVHWLWEGETGLNQEFTSITDSWTSEAVGYLWHPGAVVRLDEGRLDFGVQRSPELNRKNDLEIMSESFEGIAFRGVQPPLRLTMPLCPSGLQSGTADVSSLVCAGS